MPSRRHASSSSGFSSSALRESATARSRSPLRVIGEPADFVGFGVFRIEGNGLVVVGDGAIEVAFVLIGDAAHDVGGVVFRIEDNPLVVIGDGAIADYDK